MIWLFVFRMGVIVFYFEHSFGLKVPWLNWFFSKCLAAVLAHFQHHGIHIYPYMGIWPSSSNHNYF